MLMIDYLVVGVIAISAIVGLMRGFFPELTSLAGWVIAVWCGWNFAPAVEPYLAGKLNSPLLELWVARAIVFLAVLFVVGLLGQIVSLAIRKTGLSGTDRTLGLVFGLARGAVIFGIAVLFARGVDMQNEPWWAQSRTIPYGEQIAGWLHNVLPDQLSRHLPAVSPFAPETEAELPAAAAGEI